MLSSKNKKPGPNSLAAFFPLALLLSLQLRVTQKVLAAETKASANDGSDKVLAQFPPAAFKFERAKAPLKLHLAFRPSANEMPYWRSKGDIYRKMFEDRLIPVSVKKENLSNGMVSFEVKGAGIVHQSHEIAYKASQEFDQLPKVSSNFKNSYYDEKNKQLFLVVQALGFETRMILALDFVKEKMRSEIQFEVVWGELKGMTGAVGFEDARLDNKFESKADSAEESSEVSIMTHYQAKKFPLPKVFMGFAFEVVTQKVAEKMRSFIESQR